MSLLSIATEEILKFAKKNNLEGKILHASEDEKGIVALFGKEETPFGNVDILFDKETHKCEIYHWTLSNNLDRTAKLHDIF